MSAENFVRRIVKDEISDQGLVDGEGNSDLVGGPDLISAGLLAAMGSTYAQLAALPDGIKDVQPAWGRMGRAIGYTRLDNPTNGIPLKDFLRDFNSLTYENEAKWVTTEQAGQGVFDYSRLDSIDATLAPYPSVAYKTLHLGIGQSGYNPTWANAAVAADPSQITAIVAGRVNSLKAKFPNDPFFAIDVVNEVCSNAPSAGALGNYVDNRGWRVTNNAFYTAGLANNPGNPAQWIEDLFTNMAVAFPTAELRWVDYGIEASHQPESYTRGLLPSFWNTVAQSGPTTFVSTASNYYPTTNDTRDICAKNDRIKYEIWRMKSKGVPIHGVGYQLHLELNYPDNFQDLLMTFQDWNRWGVRPAVTELNVRNKGGANVFSKPWLTSESDATNRVGAYRVKKYLDLFLAHTPLREITQWSPAIDSNGDGQTSTQTSAEGTRDFPIRKAIMLALASAVAPEARTLKRGTRFNGRNVLPLWMTNSAGGGVNLNQASNHIALSAATSVQAPWKWCDDAWMARPIASNDLILVDQFMTTGNPAADTVLIGIGNATSGTPTNGAYLILSSTGALRLEIVVGGANVLTQQIAASVVAATAQHRVAVRINGTAISYTYDGGTVGTATATGSFSDQTAIYFMARPDTTSWSAVAQHAFWEVHHGADYSTNSLLQTLSTPEVKEVTLMPYLGD